MKVKGILALVFFPLAICAQTCPTGTIKVGINCICHSCSDVIEVDDLETYVKRVLAHEWYPSWGGANWSGGMNSLKAGAVAIRSYTISRMNNSSFIALHNGGEYDICDNTCCHVYNTAQSSNTDAAVDATMGYILVAGNGKVGEAEFAHETNDNYPGVPQTSGKFWGQCGDGKFQKSVSGPPINGGDCYPEDGIDEVCLGIPYDPNSHPRGMCQIGSARWSTGYTVPSNNNKGVLNGYPTKDWQELLSYYYPYWTLSVCAPILELNSQIEISPSSVHQGDVIAVTASILNNSIAIWQGDFSASICDNNGDPIMDLGDPIGISLNGNGTVSLSFTSTLDCSQFPSGIYEIHVQYLTLGSNEKQDVGSGSFENPAGVNVDASSNCDIDVDYPIGDFENIFMQGWSLNPSTNQLEFIFALDPAEPGDETIDIVERIEFLKKIFKQSLVIPNFEQWISINPTTQYFTQSYGNVVQPVAPYPFRNTDMSNIMFTADLYLKIFWDAYFRVGCSNEWKSLVQASPYWSSLDLLGFNTQVFYPCRAAIIPGDVDVLQETNSYQVTDNELDVESSNYHTPYFTHYYTDWDIMEDLLSSSEISDLTYRKDELFDDWFTDYLPDREPAVVDLLNFDPLFKEIKQIYTTIALAHQYKTLGNDNKPYEEIIDGRDLTGFDAVPLSDDYIVDQWNAWYIFPDESYYYEVPFIDIQDVSRVRVNGGCVMGSIPVNVAGPYDSLATLIDSATIGDHSYILTGGLYYQYGGTLDLPYIELKPAIEKPITKTILGHLTAINNIVFNAGNKIADAVPVRLYDQFINEDGSITKLLLTDVSIPSIDSFSHSSAPYQWTPITTGIHSIIITVDEANIISELNKSNNADTIEVNVLDNHPTVFINAPLSGSVVWSRSTSFLGGGSDNIDGELSGGSLVWSSDIDGNLGTGSSLEVDSLTFGNHNVTLTATNSVGISAQAFVNVQVVNENSPMVSILTPKTNDTLSSETNILFWGTAAQLNEGDLCDNTVWESELDSMIGNGCFVSSQLTEGVHTIKFTATNSSGGSSTASIHVYVVNGNPVITINSPSNGGTFFQNQVVIFNGTVSDFPEGDLSAKINWNSDKEGFLGTGSSISKLLSVGEHLITASVIDGDGHVAQDSIHVIIKFNQPSALIVSPANNSNFFWKDTVAFIGSSNDIQDGPLHNEHLLWYSNLQGFIGAGDTVIISSLTYGDQTITLVAMDFDGASDTTSVSILIDVGQPNCLILKPTNDENFYFRNPVTLLGTAVDVQDGILSGQELQWNSNIDGFIGSGDSILTNLLSYGDQTISLSATDQDGFIGTTSVHFYIEPPHPPAISIYYPSDNKHFLHGEAVNLKASASDYEEGTLGNNRITWSSSINGNIGVGKLITLNNLSIGNHIITASAIDTTALVSSSMINLIIDQKLPDCSITFPISGSIFLEGTAITLVGLAVDFEDGELHGNSLYWISDLDGNLGTGDSLQISSLSTGSHLINLIATDSLNGSDTAMIIVVVQSINSVLLNEFSDDNDSVVVTFGISGGDSIVYIRIPKDAHINIAQVTVAGDSVPFSNIEYFFAKRMGSDIVFDAFQAKSGSIYSSGQGGYGTFDTIEISGSTPSLFVAKQNSNGAIQWVKKYKINSQWQLTGGNALAEDNQRNIYVTGTFRWDGYFDCDSFLSCDTYDGFIQKIDSFGNCIWTKHIYSGGNGNSEDFINDIAVDNYNNIYITGIFGGPSTTGYIGNYSIPLTAGGPHSFVAKLDSTGEVLWTQIFPGTGNSVCVDNDQNVLIAGLAREGYFGTIYFTPSGSSAAFVAKFSSSGLIEWIRGGGVPTTSTNTATEVTIDSLDNAYATGYFNGQAIDTVGIWDGITVPSLGSYDIFLVKYTKDGEIQFAKSAIGTYIDDTRTVAVINNKVIVAGNYASDTLHAGSLNIFNNTSGYQGVGIEYDLDGNELNSFQVISSATDIFQISSCDNEILIAGEGGSQFGIFYLNGGGGYVAKRNSNTIGLPLNPSINVCEDSVQEWNYNGYYQGTQNTNDFSVTLNQCLSSYYNQSGDALIPILLHSQNAGILVLKYLNIQYQISDTVRPILQASVSPSLQLKNQTFTVNATVTDNDVVDSVYCTFYGTTFTLTNVSGNNYLATLNVYDSLGMFPVKVTAVDRSLLKDDTVLYLTVVQQGVDLAVAANDISIDPDKPSENENASIKGKVSNFGDTDASSVDVQLEIDSIPIATQEVEIASGDSVLFSFTWTPVAGDHTVTIKVDPNNSIMEPNKSNNVAGIEILVQDITPPEILSATVSPNPGFLGDSVRFEVQAVDQSGIATVNVSWLSQNTLATYNSFLGRFTCKFLATAVGNSDAIITATDSNGIITVTEVPITILENLPDLSIFLSDINFQPEQNSSGGNDTISVKIFNKGSVTVSGVEFFCKANGETIFLQEESILSDSFIVVSIITPVICGNVTFEFNIDSANAIVELNDDNNVVIVSHQFCVAGTISSVNAVCMPNVVSIGESFLVSADVLPDFSDYSVTATWNSQSYPLLYNSLTHRYEINLNGITVGDFLLPIYATDSNNVTAFGSASVTVSDTLFDIAVESISASAIQFTLGYPITVVSEIANNGATDISNLELRWTNDDVAIDSVSVSVAGGSTFSDTLVFYPSTDTHTITMTADPDNSFAEVIDTNNSKSISFNIGDDEPPVIIYVNHNVPLYEDGALNLTTIVFDNIGVANVLAVFDGDTYPMIIDSSGFYAATVPNLVAGTYIVAIIATDVSGLTASTSFIVTVNPEIADLVITQLDLHYSQVGNDSTAFSITVHNNGGLAANNFQVVAALDSITIYSGTLSIEAGQEQTVAFNYSGLLGYRVLNCIVDVDSSILEISESNNEALINVFLPDLIPPSSPVPTVTPASCSSSNSFQIAWSPVSDNGGVVTYEYEVDQDGWINVGTATIVTIVANESGIYNVFVRAIDESSNYSDIGVTQIEFDNSAPNAPVLTELHCGPRWTTHDSPYLTWINPGDAGCGIDHYELSLDGGTETNIGYTDAVHPPLTNGIHTLKMRAVDKVNQASEWSNIITVYIDLDNPPTPIITSPTHPDESKWYKQDSVELKWETPIETSTIVGYFYMLNHDSLYQPSNSSYWTVHDSITITALPTMDTVAIRIPDGVWYFHLTAEDTVGHLSTTADHYRLKIDKTPPQSHLSVVDTVQGCAFPIDILSEDNLSGVEQSNYRIDNGAWLSDLTFEIDQPGLHVVEFYSVDSADNYEPPDTAFLFVTGSIVPLNLGNDTTVCDSMLLSAPNGYGYNWSSGAVSSAIEVTQTGLYWLEMSDSSECKTTDSILVNVLHSPVAFFGFTQAEDSAFFNNLSQDATSYLWIFGDGDSSSSVNPTHVYTSNGIFIVQLIAINDSCGVSVFEDTLVVMGLNTFENNLSDGEVLIYPNPNGGGFLLLISNSISEISRIDIINTLGQVVYMVDKVSSAYRNSYEINATVLPSGVYYLRVLSEENEITRKVVIER